MTDVLKALGQLAATATTPETLYTVTAAAQATVSSLVVCNRTSGGLTFRLSVRPAAATQTDAQYLFYDTPLAGNSTLTAVLGLTLAETDVVTVYASATGLSFSLFGVETT